MLCLLTSPDGYPDAQRQPNDVILHTAFNADCTIHTVHAFSMIATICIYISIFLYYTKPQLSTGYCNMVTSNVQIYNFILGLLKTVLWCMHGCPASAFTYFSTACGVLWFLDRPLYRCCPTSMENCKVQKPAVQSHGISRPFSPISWLAVSHNPFRRRTSPCKPVYLDICRRTEESTVHNKMAAVIISDQTTSETGAKMSAHTLVMQTTKLTE